MKRRKGQKRPYHKHKPSNPVLRSVKDEAQVLENKPERRQVQRRRIENILQEAERLVYQVRNKEYKHPMQNFTNIAQLWNAYHLASGRDHDLRGLSALDVAAFNILQKLARISTNQTHMDSWLDIAGYAACAERIIKNS